MEFIQPGTTLGVGTGSTVNCLIEMLPEVRERIDRVVSSSKASTTLLEEQGFEVLTLNETGDIDLYIDGADESNKHLQLIKGGGGALTREKVLAAAARRFVCIVDDSKLVGMLGAFPLPVEVLPMAQEFVARRMLKMRGQPIWREGFVTDNGNHILDVHRLQIANPIDMEARINRIPGVVAVGLFAVDTVNEGFVGHAADPEPNGSIVRERHCRRLRVGVGQQGPGQVRAAQGGRDQDRTWCVDLRQGGVGEPGRGQLRPQPLDDAVDIAQGHERRYAAGEVVAEFDVTFSFKRRRRQ
mgnify:CR=1 FL=1